MTPPSTTEERQAKSNNPLPDNYSSPRDADHMFRDTKDVPPLSSPFPRHRDEHGDTYGRKHNPDLALPNAGTLLSEYENSLSLIGKYRPLRAAMLRDLIRRIEATVARHRIIVREEYANLRSFNDNASQTRPKLQDEIDKIEEERDTATQQFDTQCLDSRQELFEARKAYASERVRCGLPIKLVDLGVSSEQPNVDSLDVNPIADLTSGIADTSTESFVRMAQAKADGIKETISAAPALLREGTRIVSQFLPHNKAKLDLVTPNGTESSTLSELPPSIPFPIADAKTQAKPVEVHAYENGYPISSSAAHQTHLQRWMNFAALIVCGVIFGFSIGSMLDYIDPLLLKSGDPLQYEHLGICAFFGIILFFILGEASERSAAYVSELYHSSLVAIHRTDPSAVGKWLLRSVRWMGAIALLIFITLIVIEVFVERYGIVQIAINGMSDYNIANHKQSGASPLIGPPSWIIALVASVPFMCYHAILGWVTARMQILADGMTAEHVNEAWSIARRTYDEQTKQINLIWSRREAEQHATSINSRPEKVADELLETVRTETTDKPHVNNSNVPHSTHAANIDLSNSDEDKHQNSAVVEATTPFPSEEQQVALAQASERVREAQIRLRECYVARREALDPLKYRIAQLQTLILFERSDLTTEAKRRIEDAYADVQGAVTTFDAMFKQEMEITERLMRGGIFVRCWLFLFRAAH